MIIARSILTLALFTLIAISARAQESNDLYTISDEKIDIKFTTEYTFDDLVGLKGKLKIEDIDLNYTSLQFDDRGFLLQISASIDYNDGNRGSFESRQLLRSDSPGFHRDYTEIPRQKK